MILECRDLSKSFYTKKALNEVSLKLEGGKIYGLLGENGSGKTTWMKIISGLTKPTSGEVLFKEHPWFYGDKAEIAYMSTEPFFYSFLDVNGVGQYYKDFFPDFDEKKFHDGKKDVTGRQDEGQRTVHRYDSKAEGDRNTEPQSRAVSSG